MVTHYGEFFWMILENIEGHCGLGNQRDKINHCGHLHLWEIPEN